jgi:hypothetical protein
MNRLHLKSSVQLHFQEGFELSKNKRGLTSAHLLSSLLHTGDSASLTTAGVETDPSDIPGHPVWGVKQTTGGFNPQLPAIQSLFPGRGQSTSQDENSQIVGLLIVRAISLLFTNQIQSSR